MSKVLDLTYASSLTDICEGNSSFDTGVLRIAYPGLNRNGSFISKETFEKCVKTMYNCPIVCNYDRETDTLGGHDMDVCRDEDGGLRLVNITTPVGCIPESAKYWWDSVEEDNGETHEYLFADVLLWKRQEAYRKIKKDGITAHSMEINVLDGEMSEDTYVINDFEFTAFALIGVEPCFESAALTLFSNENFKDRLAEMMQDLKDYSLACSAQGDATEGGDTTMEDNVEVVDQIEESQDAPVDEPVDATDEPATENYELNNNVRTEIIRAVQAEVVENGDYPFPRYCFFDFDADAGEVYANDTLDDWKLYGFTFTTDGDSVTVDFESKKRKKLAVVDFEGDENQFAGLSAAFVKINDALKNSSDALAETTRKFEATSADLDALNAEVAELRSFKKNTLEAQAAAERNEILAEFDDLNGNEEFEALKDACDGFSADDLAEKCYAIRGRCFAKRKPAEKTPKIKVVDHETAQPYGGVVERYTSE